MVFFVTKLPSAQDLGGWWSCPGFTLGRILTLGVTHQRRGQ